MKDRLECKRGDWVAFPDEGKVIHAEVIYVIEDGHHFGGLVFTTAGKTRRGDIMEVRGLESLPHE